MRLPKAWKEHRRMRDDHPALSDSLVRELAVTVARYQKAQKMADVLMSQQATAADARKIGEDIWTQVEVLAGCTSSSVTRALVVLILEDREKQMEGLMNEVEAIEYVRGQYTPAELYR